MICVKIVKKIMSHAPFIRQGYEYNASVLSDFIYNYRNLTKNNLKYTGDYRKTNAIKEAMKELRDNHSAVMNNVNDDIAKLLSKYISNKNNEEDMHWTRNYVNTTDLATDITNQVGNRLLESASSIHAYWTLAKCLEGIDERTANQRVYNKTIKTAESEKWSYKRNPILEALEKMGVWYVNHITTYQSKLYEGGRNHYDRGTTVAHDYLRQYATYPNSVTSTNKTLTLNSGQDMVLETAQGARISYKHNLTSVGNNNNLTQYAEDYNDEIGSEQYAGYAGDDCNSFAMSVIRFLSKGDRGQDENGENRLDSDGISLQYTSAENMASADDFEAAMMNLGYNKYAYRNGRWVKFVKVDDEIIQSPLTEVYNNSDFRMSIDFLEPGDLLCKSGHVEFYVGYNYDVTYYDPRLGRSSGISSITLNGKATQGHSTFGWGGAQNDFPKQNYYFTYNQTNNGFVWHAGEQTDSDYKVIWRKN